MPNRRRDPIELSLLAIFIGVCLAGELERCYLHGATIDAWLGDGSTVFTLSYVVINSTLYIWMPAPTIAPTVVTALISKAGVLSLVLILLGNAVGAAEVNCARSALAPL